MKKSSLIPFGESTNHEPDIDNSNIVVLPLCYENSASYGKGSENGPIFLLQASEQLECMDEVTFVNWCKLKIHTRPLFYPSNNPDEAICQMKEEAAKILEKKKFLLSIGGDHSISIGPIMAAAEIFPDLGVLQIDAHLDLRDTWNGSKYNHACVMRRVIEDAKCPVTQVGIRSFSPEEAEYMTQNNLKPIFAHHISNNDNSWIHRIVSSLPEKVYISIDLDGLDPSELPGTGTPEPGGLTYRQLLEIIKAVSQKKHIVAADINELAKIEGTQVSEFTAAKIATKLFVYCV